MQYNKVKRLSWISGYMSCQEGRWREGGGGREVEGEVEEGRTDFEQTRRATGRMYSK